MTKNNLEFWDKVKTTDPKHTKPVRFGGRKFTSIDPMWQIQRATQHMGRVGQGWTYSAEYGFVDTLVTCQITIHYEDETGTKCAYGPVMGAEEYKTHSKDAAKQFLYHPDGSPIYRYDSDAPKKAMTDALTKALSHLGFNADVFLGLFDDQKYVTSMANQYNQEERAEKLAKDNQFADQLTAELKGKKITIDEAKAQVKARAGELDKAIVTKLVSYITTLEKETSE